MVQTNQVAPWIDLTARVSGPHCEYSTNVQHYACHLAHLPQTRCIGRNAKQQPDRRVEIVFGMGAHTKVRPFAT
jgi:hypothetical protein